MHTDSSIALVPLRARDGSVRAYAIIDADLADWANQWRWCMDDRGYAYRKTSRRRGSLTIRLHRELLGLVHWTGLQGDHIDRDRLNCRMGNLRVATHLQNHQNMPSVSGSSSRHRGVCWHGPTGKWMARIKVGGKSQYLGVFTGELEAARVAKDARLASMPFATD